MPSCGGRCPARKSPPCSRSTTTCVRSTTFSSACSGPIAVPPWPLDKSASGRLEVTLRPQILLDPRAHVAYRKRQRIAGDLLVGGEILLRQIDPHRVRNGGRF